MEVATRYTGTEECGLGESAQKDYCKANEEDVSVSDVSATGYLIRMIKASASLRSSQKPMCWSLGYMLDGEGKCSYVDAYDATPVADAGHKENVKEKMCLCYHFSKTSCYTCGHYVYRLKDTTTKNPDGTYQILSAEHVFQDYQFSRDHEIALPEPAAAGA